MKERNGQSPPVLAVGERWTLSGALTMDSAAQLLSASRDAPLPASGMISLSGLEQADSAAVAVLLAWKRRAAAEGRPLSFAEVPPNLAALAELYGVVELLAPGTDRPPAPVA